MSYLKAISEALESQRYRSMTGGDRGIAKAIARRDRPQSDDWEWLAKIVAAVLNSEEQSHLEGFEADRKHEQWAYEIADLSPKEDLLMRLANLRGQHTGPEVNAAGTRSTRKATANEGAREAFNEIRAIERALEIKDDQLPGQTEIPL